MFSNFRTRRSSKTEEKSEKGPSNNRSIFRKKQTAKDDNEQFDAIEQTLTMTLSADSDDEPVSEGDDAEEINQEFTTIKFTEQDEEVIQGLTTIKFTEQDEEVAEELTLTFTKQEVLQNELNHTRQLSQHQQEIYRMEAVLEELKMTHALKMAEKDQELAEAKDEFEKVLDEKEEELIEVETKLQETKVELKKVCSVLTGTQHDMHELQTNDNWQAYFWSVSLRSVSLGVDTM
jgi:hypothetical protein